MDDLFLSANSDSGSIPSVTPLPNFLSLGVLAYDKYEVNTSYEEFSGQLPLPLSGADPSATRIVRLHAPYTVKIVRWGIETVCPIGVKPAPPHWDTGDDDETLIYKVIRTQAPTITPGGNGFVWRMSGEYRYARAAASTNYPSGATPVSVLSAGNFVVEEADFSELVLSTIKGPIKGPVNAIPALPTPTNRASITTVDAGSPGREFGDGSGTGGGGKFRGDECTHT